MNNEKIKKSKANLKRAALPDTSGKREELVSEPKKNW